MTYEDDDMDVPAPPRLPSCAGSAAQRRGAAAPAAFKLVALAVAVCLQLIVSRQAHASSVCSWVSGGTCQFGNTYSQSSGQAVNATGTLVFNCTTVGSAVTVIMYAGTSGSESSRSFSGYTSYHYQLYTDAAMTNYFGSTTGHTIIVSSPILGNNTVTYYCSVFASQAIPTGGYYDQNWTLIQFGGSSAGTMTYEYMTVNGTCSVSNTGDVAFGSYDSIVANKTSPLNGSGSIGVNCTTYLPYTVELDQGSWAASGSTDSVPLRQVHIPSWRLKYYLYQDSARSVVWGNTTSTGVAGTGTGSSQTLTIYGSITAGQNTKAGDYTDVVTATVVF